MTPRDRQVVPVDAAGVGRRLGGRRLLPTGKRGAVVTMVGVVVAVRDGEAHLRTALESVVGQVPPPHDVVVVDGGSIDGSVAVARSVPGVRVIHQVGAGLAGGRNEGVAALAADCELVAFCDSDDTWTPGALRERLGHLGGHPDTGAVIGRVVRRPLPGEVVPAAVQERLGVPMPGYTPGALLVRRTVLDATGGFDETLHLGTDTDWFVRVATSDVRLDQLDVVVLEKGVRASSLSTDVDAYRTELLRVARAYVSRRRAAGRGPT